MKLETSPGNPALIPSLPNDGDLLTKEYHFLQIFQVKREQAPEFEQALKSYIHFLLNGFGLFFYRASYSTSSLSSSSSSSSPPAGGPAAAVAALPFQHLPPSSQDGPSAGPEPPRVLFTVNLSLFTAKRLLEEVYPPLAPLKARQALDSRRLLDDFLDPSLYSGYWSELLYEQASARRQPVFRPEQMPKSTHHGHIKELGWGASELFTRWWLIMPRAQWDFFDLLYQTYTFDIAHQSYQTKITHFFTIPANICMTVCLLCQFTFGFDAAGPFGPSLGLLSSLLLSLIYLAYGAAKNVRAWGVATACATMLLYLVAGLWDHAFRLPDAPWYNPTGSLLTNPLSLLYLASILEAWSHMIVPQLPPFCLGRNHWEDTWNFIINGERLFQFLGVVAAFIFSPLVSYISCIHLIGDMTIYLMLHLGYNQGFFEDYCRLVRKAELTGNPNVDDVPFKFHQLIHGMPGNSGDCLPAKR